MDPTRFVGIPYRAGGASRRGADCWGLFRLVERAVFGRRLPRLGILPAQVCARVRAFGRADASGWQPLADWRQAGPGDALLFGRAPGLLLHIGVAVGDGRVLHSVAGAGSVCEPIARVLELRGLPHCEAWTAP